jgi:hypothetical protein
MVSAGKFNLKRNFQNLDLKSAKIAAAEIKILGRNFSFFSGIVAEMFARAILCAPTTLHHH